MTFTSWQFGVFVAAVFGAYYLPPFKSFQVQLLVVASLFFYGYGQPELLPLLAIAVFGTYLFLILALHERAIWLPAGIAFNLALLAFFKYKFLFIAPTSPGLTPVAPIDFLLRLPLPIGISFFVFHNISLLVDLTRLKNLRPNLTDVILYIIFFPQLVSGPITRAEMFMPQIKPKSIGDIPFVEATKWILTGFFFKLYVANNLNEMTSYMDYPLYETPESGSFSEFWTRWHISLSSWLRTYLYIPLGGNRCGSARTCLNLMIVMGLGGLWHGAGLSYLVWGLLHGLLLVVERPFINALQSIDSAAFRAVRIGFVFVCVTMLWIFFKLPNFDHALSYLSGMFMPTTNPNPPKLHRDLALLYCLPVVIQHFASGSLFEGKLRSWEPYLYGFMAGLMYLEAGPETAFIYFQF